MEKHVCIYCNQEFKNGNQLRIHKKEKHEGEWKKRLTERNSLRRKKDGWICKYCDAKFSTKAELYEHIHKIHQIGKDQKYNWICKYCNQEFTSRQKLFEHYKICDEKLKLPVDSLGRIISKSGHQKAAETLHNRYKTGELKHTIYHFNSEERAHLAMKMKERRQIVNFQCNYNPKACEYMDKLNKENHWNLQHALNGGEIHVGPYSLDGYDKELNIAFEYDENTAHHNSEKNKLKDKFRQEYIIEKLNCEFWRYSEKDDILYKIINE